MSAGESLEAGDLAPSLSGDHEGRMEKGQRFQQPVEAPFTTGTSFSEDPTATCRLLLLLFPGRNMCCSNNDRKTQTRFCFSGSEWCYLYIVYTPAAFKYPLTEMCTLCFYITSSHPQLVTLQGSKVHTKTKSGAMGNSSRN